MNYKFTLRCCIVLVWLLGSFQLSAQEFYELMNDPSVPLEKVQAAAKQYFETHSNGKGSGYKAFKRWEYEQKFKRNSKGRRLNTKEVANVLAERKTQQANQRLALPGQPVYTELGPHSNNPAGNGGVGSGRITYIETDPQNSSVLYAAGVGGIWKSVDAGVRWKPISDNLPYLAFSVTVHPTQSNIVLAGFLGMGVFKSMDGGNSWSPTSLNYGTAFKILFHPTDHNIVFVAGNAGLFRSDNMGDTYVNVVNATMNDMDFKPGDPSVIYACGNDVYRSVNGGLSFDQVINGITTSGRSFLAVTPANPNYVYIVQGKSESLGYIYRSVNSGASFTTRLVGSASNGTNYLGYSPWGEAGQAWYDMAITASPTNAEQILIGGIYVYGSLNGGTSFTQVNSPSRGGPLPFVHADIHALEWKGNNIYVGCDGGVYRSTDAAATFTDLSNGIGNREFYRLGGTEADPYRIAAGAQDNGQSILLVKGVNNWRDWAGGDGMEAMIDYNDKNIVYSCSQNGPLAKTTDGGLTFAPISNPPEGGAWVTPLFMDPVTSSTIYIAKKDVWKSADGGLSWTKISNFGIEGVVTSATIAKSNNQYLYASNEVSIWGTKNGGATWQDIRTSTVQGSVMAITVHPSNANRVAVLTNVGVYVSTDAGTTWLNTTYNLPDIGKRSILYQNSPHDILYVSLDVGLFYLKPGTTNWVEYTNGLPNVPVAEMEINYTLGMLRVATSGRGLWEVPMITDATANVLPTAIIASPRNGASYTAPADIAITVGASDVDGNIAKVDFYIGTTLIGSDLTAPYFISWNAVPEGSYILTASATDNSGAVVFTKEVFVRVNDHSCMYNTSKITGSIMGSLGSWDGFSTRDKACDGDINTYFDGLVDYVWAGINTNKSYRVTGISFYPRPGSSDRMVGGRFQGSNVEDFSVGVVDLATITSQPLEKWNCLQITNTNSFRYLRYHGPVNGFGNVSEVEFYGDEVTGSANPSPTVIITSPGNNASFSTADNVILTATASDANGTVAKVSFYDGSKFLGTDFSSPYSFTWSGMSAGAHVITAKAVDNNGSIGTSSFITINITSLLPNILPVVEIYNPASNSTMVEHERLLILASASDEDGTVQRVNFYNLGVLLGTDSTSPYSYEWKNAPIGNHIFTAEAIDNNGGITTSTSVHLNIVEGCIFTDPLITGTVMGSSGEGTNTRDKAFDGNITTYFNGIASQSWVGYDAGNPYQVSFFKFYPRAGFASRMIGGKFQGSNSADFSTGVVTLATITTLPFDSWNCLEADVYPFVRYLRYIGPNDGFGNVAEVQFLGYPENPLPVVNITSPLNNTSFTAPASITISATASDLNGTVSNVQFFNGTTLLGTDNTSPYTYTWSSVPAGSYSITARATDNQGALGTSTVVTINVDNTAPTVSITSPLNNASFTDPASITINATAADANGTVSTVQFYNGTTLLGTDNTSPYSYTWTGVAAGTYSITARATDNNGAVTTSTAVTVVVSANPPPTVSITSPLDNASFTAPASITINATAADANGTVSNVQFYNGTTLLGSDNTSPYSFAWNSVAAGTYSLMARATDNQGAVTTSTTITVVVSTNPPPTVSITSPLNNSTFTPPASITINATAADANGTIANVQFYNGTTLLGSDNTSPYSYTWSSVPAGTYSITARATDNQGAVTTSSAVVISGGNPPPTVSITSPLNNASFTAPASITINATAADANGTVSNVQFYNGTTLLGSDATSPYSFIWGSVAAGTYSLTARATDDLGAVTTSTVISVTVTSGSGNCVNKPIPDATKWVVRNNWNDQGSGSGVANTTEALQVTHRAWGNSYLWVGESGTPYTVTSGKTYTIGFDYKDHAGVALSSMQVAFASNVGTGGDPTLKFPAVTVPSGYSSSSYTTKSVSISATSGGTAYLCFKLNWSGQPNQAVVDLFKNVSICEVTSGRLDNVLEINEDMIYPNPAKNEVTVRLSSEEQARIELMDARGTVLRSFDTSARENSITLEGFSAGLYLIRVKEGSREKVYRLIKE